MYDNSIPNERVREFIGFLAIGTSYFIDNTHSVYNESSNTLVKILIFHVCIWWFPFARHGVFPSRTHAPVLLKKSLRLIHSRT